MSDKVLTKATAATDPLGAEKVAPAVAPGPAFPSPLAGLTVGSASDPAEAAADAMADAALRRVSVPEAEEHRHGAGCDNVRRSSAPAPAATIGAAGGVLGADAEQAIAARRGGGEALPSDILRRMESGFGQSFSSVRIHTDAPAAGLAGGMSAAAFTTGNDVYFGAGQFRPGTPDGDHMIAHELAHVVQGNGAVRRFGNPLKKLGKAIGLIEKTDDEKAADLAAAEEKKNKNDKKAADKAESKKQKAAAAAESKENKSKAKAHTKLEKSHQADQKLDRVRGVESREQTKSGLEADQITNEADGKGKTSEKANDLHAEFETWLDKEADFFISLLEQGIDPEKARGLAYQQIWLTDAPEHIRAVRPPRETAAERLASAIKDERRDDAIDDSREAKGALGGMLGKKVEKTYERAETEYDQVVKLFPDLSAEMHRQLVDTNIWDKAPAEISEKRPKDRRIELKARAEARERLKLRPTPPDKVDESVFDKHEGRMEKVQDGVGKGGKVAKVASLGLGLAGKPKDKLLQAGEPESDDPVKGNFVGKAPGPVGTLAKEINNVQNRMAKGEKDDTPDPIKATSDETKAAKGIGAVKDIIGGLLDTVQNIMGACKAIAKAHEERTARNILAATKISADAVKSAASTAGSTAKFAGSFDPGVMKTVNSFIPGLNIGISALGLISQGATLADVAMRMHETNNAVFDTRVRGMSGDTSGGPDVLIFPLLKVAQTYTKKLEQASWSTGVAVSDLTTGIATVASGGGFGIPTAVQAGVKVIDMLHSLGHLIADEVLARLSQKSRTDATASLEGSAEQQLKNDPSMAIDALIVQARKGDDIAMKFVTGYDIKQDEVKTGKLSDLRAKLLGTMGLDADPLTMYQKFKKGAASVKATLGGVADKFTATGDMAQARTGDDGKSRGFGWRVKMMFKGETKFKRSVAKTEAVTGKKLGAKDEQPGPVPRETLVFIGTFALPVDPTPQEVDTFLNVAKGFSEDVLNQALADKRNTEQEAQDTLLFIIADKAALAS